MNRMTISRKLLAWALLLPAAALTASEPPRAIVDCGTLEGVGAVVLILNGERYRVDIDCGRRT